MTITGNDIHFLFTMTLDIIIIDMAAVQIQKLQNLENKSLASVPGSFLADA